MSIRAVDILPKPGLQFLALCYRFVTVEWQHAIREDVPDQGFERRCREVCVTSLGSEWTVSQPREMQFGAGLDTASGIGHEVGRIKKSRLDERIARCGPTEAQKLEQLGAILDYESRLSEWATTQARELRRLGAEGDYQTLCAKGCTPQVLALVISLVRFAPFVEKIWTQANGGTSKQLEAHSCVGTRCHRP